MMSKNENILLNNNIWKKLPIDIIIYIFTYHNAIRYRNGVFINVIDNNDLRYKLLSQLYFRGIEHMYNNISDMVYYHRRLNKYKVICFFSDLYQTYVLSFISPDIKMLSKSVNDCYIIV